MVGLDPEHRDSTNHYAAVIAIAYPSIRALSQFKKPVTTQRHHFHVVRGDAAVLMPHQEPSASRWYIRRWVEGVAAPGDSSTRAGEPDSTGSAAPVLKLGIQFTNPAPHDVPVWFAIPGAGVAQIEMFDVAGRRIVRRDLQAAERGTLPRPPRLIRQDRGRYLLDPAVPSRPRGDRARRGVAVSPLHALSSQIRAR